MQLVSLTIDILNNGPAKSPSMKEVRESDAVLILGEDLTNTAPMMALAVRQSVKQIRKKMAEKFNVPNWQDSAVKEIAQETRGPLFIAGYSPSKLDEIATGTYYASPSDIARIGIFHS